MKKRMIIIVSIIVIFGIIILSTYAFYRKEVFSQNASFTMDGVSVTYNGGNNISGIKLIPVTTKEKGVTDNTAIYKEISVSANRVVNFNLYLDINTLGIGLKMRHLSGKYIKKIL